MKRAAVISTVVMVVGAVLAAGAVVTVGGGIPYPDGPNHGFVTPEGCRRAFGPYAAAVVIGGGGVAVGAAAVLVITVARAHQSK